MMTWRLLSSEAELKQQLRNLKRNFKGSFCTNYQSFNNDIDNVISYTELFFRTCENNIDVIRRDDDFYRFYYAHGGIDEHLKLTFPRSVNSSIIVCDMIEIEGAEKQSRVLRDFCSQGFVIYKTFHLWECVLDEYKEDKEWSPQVKVEKNITRLAEIYNYFDPYSDYLPMKRFFRRYCDLIDSLSYYSDEKYAASVIYNVEGKTATEEYIWVLNEFRGVGSSFQKAFLTFCHNTLGVRKVYAWIDDKNCASIKMHKRNGFVKTNQYKTTLLKNGQ